MAAVLDKMHVQARLHFRQRREPLGGVAPVILCIEVEFWIEVCAKRFHKGASPAYQSGSASLALRNAAKFSPVLMRYLELNEFIGNQRLAKEVSFQRLSDFLQGRGIPRQFRASTSLVSEQGQQRKNR